MNVGAPDQPEPRALRMSPYIEGAGRPLGWAANCSFETSVDSLICRGNTVQNGSFIRKCAGALHSDLSRESARF